MLTVMSSSPVRRARGNFVAGGGGALTPVWFSDWRTADLGNDLGDLADGGNGGSIGNGGKWDTLSGEIEQRGSVVTAPSGFPTAKVFRVDVPDAGTPDRHGWTEPRVTTLGEMANPGVRNWRWYFRMMESTSADHTSHPIQTGSGVSTQLWGFYTMNSGSAEVDPGEWGFYIATSDAADGHERWYLGNSLNPTSLVVGDVYRVEIQLVRTSSTEGRLHAQVANSAGTIIATDEDFEDNDGVSHLDDNPLLTLTNWANTAIISAGHNGFSTGNEPSWPEHLNDQGGFAVVDGLAEGVFIEAYSTVVGEVLP